MRFLIFLLLFLPAAGPIYAQIIFTEEAQARGIDHQHWHLSVIGGGAVFFDYDGDGDDDLFTTGGERFCRLYENLGDGTFAEVTNKFWLAILRRYHTVGAAAGDINNDGLPDLYVSTWYGNLLTGQWGVTHDILLLNQGNGDFLDISWEAGILDYGYHHSITFLDVNLDGFLDIYVTGHVEEPRIVNDSITGQAIGYAHKCFDNLLYINNRNLSFTEAADLFGLNNAGCSLAAVSTDYDNDRDIDLYIANDFGGWIVPNQLFRNNYPDIPFENVSHTSGADVGIFGMGIAAGDYDRDLDIDFYTTNIGRNVLLENDGAGHFSDVTTFAGVENEKVAENGKNTTSWGTIFLDLDNNTWPDLWVTNGRIPALLVYETGPNDPNKLYYNNQDGTFSDISEAAGIADIQLGRGAAYADIDHDGDLDVFVTVIGEGEPDVRSKLYINETVTDNHYVQFRLQGTISNREAVGARLYLYHGSDVQMQEVYGGGGSYCSQHTKVRHFGLGPDNHIDSVKVFWPNGLTEVFSDFPRVDTLYHLVEGLAVKTNRPADQSRSLSVFPNPTNGDLTIQWGLSDLSEPTQIRLTDISGKTQLLQTTTLLTNQPLSLQLNVPAGFYLLHLESGPFRAVRKVVVR